MGPSASSRPGSGRGKSSVRAGGNSAPGMHRSPRAKCPSGVWDAITQRVRQRHQLKGVRRAA
eukprot:7607793-Heterocapsa_arctica.AAC.1